MNNRTRFTLFLSAAVVAGLFVVGCSSTANIFNPTFVNLTSGGVFPLTPGPGADFVLVRVVNETNSNAEFIVTIEREVFQRDEDGNVILDEFGNPLTLSVRETKRLNTLVAAPGNEMGVLFPCSDSPINLIGLGENLLPNDAAVFIGGGGAGFGGGSGVSVGDFQPLSRLVNPPNFVCGDTVIFRAILSSRSVGTVKLESWVLPGFEQPDQFAGLNTFVNYQSFLESQLSDDE